MKLKKDEIVSAQVILYPASGMRINGSVTITAENLSEFLPSQSAVTSAINAFRSRGFEVGPFVGISFSITGPVSIFEETFGMHLHRGEDAAIEFVVGERVNVKELTHERLPKELQESVQTVTFPPPVEFGYKI